MLLVVDFFVVAGNLARVFGDWPAHREQTVIILMSDFSNFFQGNQILQLFSRIVFATVLTVA